MMHSTGTTVGASDLDVGEVWTIRVTPDDGYTDGPYTEASVTISNSDPTLTTPVISSSSGGVYNDSGIDLLRLRLQMRMVCYTYVLVECWWCYSDGFNGRLEQLFYLGGRLD